MPEQLTKHPEVTITVLKSAGAQCAEGAKQDILRACPAARFCKLPGGELCVYGLPEATSMTQIGAGEWRQTLAGLTTTQASAAGPTPLAAGLLGLLAGLAIAWLVSRRSRKRHPG